MNKWLIYVLGIITGIVLTFALSFCVVMSDDSEIIGLEMFEEPGEDMDYSQFKVLQVLESGCALAYPDRSLGTVVLIIPDETQQFYDNQKIILEINQWVQRVGTYRYTAKNGMAKTVPVVKIIDGVELPKSNKAVVSK